MNIIHASLPPNPLKPEIGDIFRDSDTGTCDYYILSQVQFGHKMRYAAISLSGGNRYVDPHTDIEKAVSGLKFVGRDMKITVSK